MSGKRQNAARKTISASPSVVANQPISKKSKVAPEASADNDQNVINGSNEPRSSGIAFNCSSNVVPTPPQANVKLERDYTAEKKTDKNQSSELSADSSTRFSPQVVISGAYKSRSGDHSDDSSDEDDLTGEEIAERERIAASVKLTILPPPDEAGCSLSGSVPSATQSTTAKTTNDGRIMPHKWTNQHAESTNSHLNQDRLIEINDQLTKVNAAMLTMSERCGRLEAGQNEVKAALAEILRRLPPLPRESLMAVEDGPPDYLLLPKDVVDRFQRSTDSVTAFGRRLARALYRRPDDYQNCRNRSPTRLDFIRRVVYSRFPPKGGETELNNWRAIVKQLDADSRHIRSYVKQNRQFTYLEDERMFVVRPVDGADNEQQQFTGGNVQNGVLSGHHAATTTGNATGVQNGIHIGQRSSTILPAPVILSEQELMRAREAAQRYAFADNVALV